MIIERKNVKQWIYAIKVMHKYLNKQNLLAITTKKAITNIPFIMRGDEFRFSSFKIQVLEYVV